MILCREATRLHTEADEGALSGTTLALYTLHMTLCGPCRRYRDQLAVTRQLLQHMGTTPEKPSAALVDRLAREIEKKP
jgi:hypothetical protein